MFGNLCVYFFKRLAFYLIGKRDFMPMLDRAEVCITERLGTFKDRGKCIVVDLFDGIEFMIVTSSATHRHSHERFANGVKLLIDRVHDKLFAIWFGKHFGAQNQKASSGDRFEAAIRNQVPCDILDKELIDGFVCVEALDDVIAVAPGIAEGDVLVQPIGVSVSCDIEPMPPPMHTVLR